MTDGAGHMVDPHDNAGAGPSAGDAWSPLDHLAVNTLRTLAIDAVEAANSGHPGTPMGAAPVAYVLWTRHLRHAPSRPDWPDRDRFVLSAGHASMLLYGLLHLTGYDLSLDELKRFRQLGSRTPGHPEVGMTAGVEATTGPLGQGFAAGVGLAIAEARLEQEFNRPGHGIVDHWTYVLASDGDIQEGIASEAASLAGHLGLGRLIVLYDDNHTQLDGPTSLAFSEDVVARFGAYGWHTLQVDDANDLAAVDAAIEAARRDSRPSLIAIRSHIAYGSPNKQDSSKAHGAALGAEEVRLTKLAYGWDPDAKFLVPDGVREWMSRLVRRGEDLADAWERKCTAYRAVFSRDLSEFDRRMAGSPAPVSASSLPVYAAGGSVSTRRASHDALAALSAAVPELIGGAADVSGSVLTDIEGFGRWANGTPDRNIRFGVREHAMGGIANGIAYHGGLRPIVGTYFVFSDYMRGSVRLAALSSLPVVYIWSHDSIMVGEDGPTHQPVEQLASLRAIPGLWVIRPCDANETIAAWIVALDRQDGPVALVLSRQDLPVSAETGSAAREGVARGAYILQEAGGGDGRGGAGRGGAGSGSRPGIILVATGSEVRLAVEARLRLEAAGLPTRVVSMPCWELFARQPQAYRDAVLPPEVEKRVSIEAGSSLGWERWVGSAGAVMGVDEFGLSGRGSEVYAAYGMTVSRVVEVARGVDDGTARGVVSVVPAGLAPHTGRRLR